ncbi:MAG: cytidylate kinase, partial [Proteobacteria bacterium]|nr:cytidylate kinase [Pseudomonadota bacterium]
MNAQLAIAIDGPAGAGKSVFGAALASALQAICIDSGIVYRAVTWIAITRGLDPDHDATLGPVAASMNLQIIPPTVQDGRQFTILIDGEDVTWELRTPDIDRTVSRPSALPGVRSAVTEQLRHLARGARVVMVGRDIGTVVLPDADVKFYVTAT